LLPSSATTVPFESLIEEEKRGRQEARLNEQNVEDTTRGIEEAQENYAITISRAYHFHMAGYHEKSFDYKS